MSDERKFEDAIYGTFETPLGRLGFTLTEANHACVWTEERGHSLHKQEGVVKTITLHRVEYALHCHLYRGPNGEWLPCDDYSKPDDYNHRHHLQLSRGLSGEASSAARNKFLEIVPGAFAKFMEDKDNLRSDAERRNRSNQIMRKQEEVQKLKDQLAAEKSVLDGLLDLERAGSFPAFWQRDY